MGDLDSTRGGHSNLPLGFTDSLMTWGNSPVWKDIPQEEIKLVWDTGGIEFVHVMVVRQ